MNWKFDFSPVTSAVEGQPSQLGRSAFIKVASVYVHMMYADLVECYHWLLCRIAVVEVDEFRGFALAYSLNDALCLVETSGFSCYAFKILMSGMYLSFYETLESPTHL